MGIETIGTGIKTLLDTIVGLRCYAPNEVPDTLELPCVVILMGSGQYATTYDKGYDASFRIILMLAKQDTPSAYNRLINYVEPTGAQSIFAKLDGDRTLSARCDSSKLLNYSGAGQQRWGNIIYLSCEFELAVWT